MKKSAFLTVLMLGAALSASAITTTLEYEDQREAASRSAISNEIMTAVGSIPEPDYSTSNATLRATIEATAPAPGNYAAVSNAAMNAATSAEVASSIDTFRETLTGGEVWPMCAHMADWASEADVALMLGYFGSSDNPDYFPPRLGQHIIWQLDAATETNAAQTAALSAKASTNDVALTPVYGGNGQRLSEWVVNPATYDGHEISIVFESEYNKYTPWANGATIGLPMDGNADTTSLSWTEPYEAPIDMTATRTENPIIGYTLGSQTNKVLASTNGLVSTINDLAAGLVQTIITNSLFNLTYDQTLGVTWRKTAEGGAFYERCYTNVNMIGVLP